MTRSARRTSVSAATELIAAFARKIAELGPRLGDLQRSRLRSASAALSRHSCFQQVNDQLEKVFTSVGEMQAQE
jgi:hypothetical protein